MEYFIIICILILISLIIKKLTSHNFVVETNKLVAYLGGKENIVDAESNVSRLKVTLRDVSKVNKDGIQKLGAKGIVEIDNQLKIIFGTHAIGLKKYIKEMKL